MKPHLSASVKPRCPNFSYLGNLTIVKISEFHQNLNCIDKKIFPKDKLMSNHQTRVRDLSHFRTLHDSVKERSP